MPNGLVSILDVAEEKKNQWNWRQINKNYSKKHKEMECLGGSVG